MLLFFKLTKRLAKSFSQAANNLYCSVRVFIDIKSSSSLIRFESFWLDDNDDDDDDVGVSVFIEDKSLADLDL